MTKRTPLPQRTSGTTPIPPATRHIEMETDIELMGRLLAGLAAIEADPQNGDNRGHPARDSIQRVRIRVVQQPPTESEDR